MEIEAIMLLAATRWPHLVQARIALVRKFCLQGYGHNFCWILFIGRKFELLRYACVYNVNKFFFQVNTYTIGPLLS